MTLSYSKASQGDHVNMSQVEYAFEYKVRQSASLLGVCVRVYAKLSEKKYEEHAAA